MQHIRLVLKRLVEKKLLVKAGKCEFYVTSVSFIVAKGQRKGFWFKLWLSDVSLPPRSNSGDFGVLQTSTGVLVLFCFFNCQVVAHLT